MTNKEWDKFHKDVLMEPRIDNDFECFLKRFCINKEKSKQYLDLGCGQGGTLLDVSNLYKNWVCYGIDYSSKALCITNYKGIVEKRENIKLKQSKADHINYANDKFDVISIILLLASIEYPQSVFKEVYRLLKTQGRIFLKELSDNECNENNKFIRRGASVYRYSEENLYKLLNDNGFKEIENYKVKNEYQNIEHLVYTGIKK